MFSVSKVPVNDQSATDAAREIERLREENEALRKSAEIWIRLYERQLARVNEATRR